ncbi:hypothetical protein C0991_002263 [Blastosporella zonata]|nr:hypothetical protein C0991_002263 [Blastosporella zonata]
MNSRKRSTSEPDPDVENSRSSKKSKRDDGSKPDKKRKRKRRRKSSVVVMNPETRSRSKSRSETVATHDGMQTEAEADAAPDNVDVEPLQDSNVAPDVEDTSPRIPYADKGKGKAREESTPSVIQSPEAHIARLQQDLEAQRLARLLRQHQTHLTQVHQALTCQICLDLLHKPFALAPCGHIVCYPCLVRWFTGGPDGPNGLEEDIPGAPGASHQHKKKNCPICRTHVTERPVEVWGVKSMVAGLARSGLVELPAPAPEAAEAEVSASTSDDPWRNIFHRANRRSFFDIFEPRPPRPPREGGEGQGLEEMGMYDADDGGIYRCIDCMHEIWRGVCTRCQRTYPGHQHDEDDEDDENLDFDHGAGGFRDLLQLLANGQGPRLGGNHGGLTSGSEDSVGLMFADEIDEDDEDDEDPIPEVIRGGPLHPLRPFAARIHPLAAFLRPDNNEDEPGIAHIGGQSGDESEGYESSFIDDVEQLGQPSPDRLPRSRRPMQRSRRQVVDNSDDESHHSDEVIIFENRSSGPGNSYRSRRRTTDEVDIDVVASDDDDGPPLFRAMGRYARMIAEDTTDESDHE